MVGVITPEQWASATAQGSSPQSWWLSKLPPQGQVSLTPWLFSKNPGQCSPQMLHRNPLPSTDLLLQSQSLQCPSQLCVFGQVSGLLWSSGHSPMKQGQSYVSLRQVASNWAFEWACAAVIGDPWTMWSLCLSPVEDEGLPLPHHRFLGSSGEALPWGCCVYGSGPQRDGSGRGLPGQQAMREHIAYRELKHTHKNTGHLGDPVS